MNLSCSTKMIKYLMFGFNLFFVISGIIIIAVGAAAKTVYTDYGQFLDGKYFSLPNMLIATGAFIFLISFFGCCGALKESWVMLAIFSLFLCLIFVFEFASGIAGYVLKGNTAEYLDNTLRANLLTYNVTHDVWDLIQETFQCCGVDSYHDWQGHLNDTWDLPLSCCQRVSGAAGVFYCNSYNSSTGTTTAGTTSAPNTTLTPPNTTLAPNITTTLPPNTTLAPNITTTLPPDTTTDGNLTTTKPGPDPNQPARKRREIIANIQPNLTNNTTTPNPPTSAPYPEGCKAAFGDYVKKHAVQIGGCALGLAIIQVIGIAFSCHLVRQLKNGYLST